ncbi:zinc finger protein 501-like isoform X3 [Periplaneta americana]|uniref:zinc finger protein 501-like isoform X3 n=1 Tax=Periplaneta americana TaxID=6978 RepID=UPI0037E82CA2
MYFKISRNGNSSKKDEMKFVLMDTIKMEPEIDRLTLKNEGKAASDIIKPDPEANTFTPNSEATTKEQEGETSVEGKFLEVNVTEIKIEPPDPSCDHISDIKYEGTENPVLYAAMKYEDEKESWNVEAVNEDMARDVTKEDDDLSHKPLQSHYHEDMKIHKSDICDSSIDSFSITQDPESDNENTDENCSLPDDTSSTHNLNVESSNKSFNKLSPNKKQHKRKDAEVKPFTCSVCGKSFGRRYNLQAHEAIHRDDRPFKCDICEKSFRKFAHLQRHESTHTSDKPFNCQICEKNFARLEYLRQHEATHTDEKHFKCNSCDKRFRQRHHLQDHELTHKGEKSLKCDICEKSFARHHYFRLHYLTHSDDKPFKCQFCEKTFAYKQHFKQHTLIHSVEKLYKCSFCDKSFTLNRYLVKHTKTHTNEKQYKCSYCDKIFAVRYYLLKHISIHTKE